jgi:hypothetical protein
MHWWHEINVVHHYYVLLRSLAEEACNDLENSSPTPSSITSAEIDSLRKQISDMEIELEESFAVTTESIEENSELKSSLSEMEDIFVSMASIFDKSDLCPNGKSAVGADEAAIALVEEVKQIASPLDRVKYMESSLFSQMAKLSEWINKVIILMQSLFDILCSRLNILNVYCCFRLS